jgi:hypothetical protein
LGARPVFFLFRHLKQTPGQRAQPPVPSATESPGSGALLSGALSGHLPPPLPPGPRYRLTRQRKALPEQGFSCGCGGRIRTLPTDPEEVTNLRPAEAPRGFPLLTVGEAGSASPLVRNSDSVGLVASSLPPAVTPSRKWYRPRARADGERRARVEPVARFLAKVELYFESDSLQHGRR